MTAGTRDQSGFVELQDLDSHAGSVSDTSTGPSIPLKFARIASQRDNCPSISNNVASAA
ncbi:hypothetical protein D3C80_2209960 [compost metagenome]